MASSGSTRILLFKPLAVSCLHKAYHTILRKISILSWVAIKKLSETIWVFSEIIWKFPAPCTRQKTFDLWEGNMGWGIASSQSKRAHNYFADAFYYFCREISECGHQMHGKQIQLEEKSLVKRIHSLSGKFLNVFYLSVYNLKNEFLIEFCHWKFNFL